METPPGTDAQLRDVFPPGGDGTAWEPGRRAGSFALFVWAFVGISLMLGAWSFATPIGAAPDEEAHTAQALAIVRGQFDVPEQRLDDQPVSWVRVPCWVDSPWVHLQPPACTPGHATTALVPTEFSNSPPLYYVVVGVPSLVLSGTAAIYAMRVAGDLLNAAMVALGIWLILRYAPRRTLLFGVLIALSPMVLFLMAVLNSSGLEIAAGFAAWCGALCVLTHPEVPRPLALWTATAVILLVLSRPTSPLDAVIIAVVFGVLVGWRDLRKRLNPSLRPLWIPVAVAIAIAVLFLLFDGAPQLIGVPPPHTAGLFSNMVTTLRLTGGYLEQCIGNFGLLSIPAPPWVVGVWTAFLAALTGAALVLSRPCRRALPVLALAIVAMTLALEAPKINTVGTYFQGRYILPMVVGFPLVASSFEWRGRRLVSRRMLTRSVLVVGIVLLVAQVASFDRALRAYQGGRVLGVSGPWLPPGGEFPVQAAFVVGAIVTLALVVVTSARVREGPATDAGSEIAGRTRDPSPSGASSP
jgi:hypothetical protein